MPRSLADLVREALEVVEISPGERRADSRASGSSGWGFIDIRRPTSCSRARRGARNYPRGFLEVRADLEHPKRDPWLEDRGRNGVASLRWRPRPKYAGGKIAAGDRGSCGSCRFARASTADQTRSTCRTLSERLLLDFHSLRSLGILSCASPDPAHVAPRMAGRFGRGTTTSAARKLGSGLRKPERAALYSLRDMRRIRTWMCGPGDWVGRTVGLGLPREQGLGGRRAAK